MGGIRGGRENGRGEQGRAGSNTDGADFPDVGYDDTADYIKPGDNDGAIADEMNGDHLNTLDNTAAARRSPRNRRHG